MFHGMFVSSRSAQFLNDPLANSILRDTAGGDSKCLIAVETSKYVIPLLRNQKNEFNLKLKEYSMSQGWTHCVKRKFLTRLFL